MSIYPISCDYACHSDRPVPDPGIDLATPQGTPLYAPLEARITFTGYVTREDGSPSYGNFTEIELLEGPDIGLRLAFAHLSQRPERLMRLHAGTLFAHTGGEVGAPGSGNSTGAHVHVRAMRDGRKIDPTKIIDRYDEELFDVPQFTDDEARMLRALIAQAAEDGYKPAAIPGMLRATTKVADAALAKVRKLEDAPPAGAHTHHASVTLD